MLPLPLVPLTLQTLFVYLAGGLLGPRDGSLSQILFLLFGLIGLPVFGMGGGPAYVMQPTFGYLLAFPLAAWTVGKLADHSNNPPGWTRLIGAHLAAMSIILLLGAVYLYVTLCFIGGRAEAWQQVAWKGALVFLPAELLKILVSVFLVRRVKVLLAGSGGG